jgi:hypothetical protein
MKYKNVFFIVLILSFVCINVYSENEDNTSKNRNEIANLLSLVIDLQSNIQVYKSKVVNKVTNNYKDELLGNIEKVNKSIEEIKGNLIELLVSDNDGMDNNGINFLEIYDYFNTVNNEILKEMELLSDKQ